MKRQNARDKGKTGRKNGETTEKRLLRFFYIGYKSISAVRLQKAPAFFLNIIFELYQLNFSGGTFLGGRPPESSSLHRG